MDLQSPVPCEASSQLSLALTLFCECAAWLQALAGQASKLSTLDSKVARITDGLKNEVSGGAPAAAPFFLNLSPASNSLPLMPAPSGLFPLCC